MGKDDRRGERKIRRQNFSSVRTPELGYYFIVTDTQETEQNYLYGLRESIPDHLKNKRLVIKVHEARTGDLVDHCIESVSLEPQYRIPWIVFDRDQVKDFDKIIKKAHDNNINVGWSNPCIEIWFQAYFGTMPKYLDSVQCCDGFNACFKKKTSKEYKKSDQNIYSNLCKYGNEERAISLAHQKLKQMEAECNNKPSEMCPGTTMHLLIEEIRNKIKQ
jgi:hypothetical protein